MKLPIAAQVYSIREEAEADFEKAMQQLAGMGYDGVELAGLYGKSAEEIKSAPPWSGQGCRRLAPMCLWKRLNRIWITR